MSNKTQGFKKSERIKKRLLFAGLFKDGRYFKTGDFSLRSLPNRLNILRLGISVKKGIFRSATQRNRVKRLIRETFRRNKDRLITGYDILIRPKKYELANSTYKEVEVALLSLLNEAGLFK